MEREKGEIANPDGENKHKELIEPKSLSKDAEDMLINCPPGYGGQPGDSIWKSNVEARAAETLLKEIKGGKE